MNRLVVSGILTCAALALCGCSKSETVTTTEDVAKPAESQPAQTQPADEESPGGTEILVRTPATRPAVIAYQQNDKVPSGRLVGVTKFAGKLTAKDLPAAQPVELEGPNGIKDPAKGEVDYYQNLRLKQRSYVAGTRQGGMVPGSCVVIIRGVKEGVRDPLSRATFLIRQGQFGPHVQFGPMEERVMFGTYDFYSTHAIMKNLVSGKVVMDAEVSAYDKSGIRDLGGGGVELKQPKMAQSAVMHEPDGYVISDPRHPWKKAYLFAIDSPYATVAAGQFAIEAVPAGKWKVDVWHPEFQPVKKTYNIEIKRDETTELAVEFLPPGPLAEPVAKPAKPDAQKPGS